MSSGFWSGVLGNHSAPACFVTVLSCSMAAGRYTSPETVSTFFLRFSLRCLGSLAVVVVLRAPCRPAMRITAGGCAARLMSATPSPMVAASSRLTMPTSARPGAREATNSLPQRLPGRERAHHFLAQRLVLDARDEVAHHRQGHVGLQQGHAHLAQHVGDI